MVAVFQLTMASALSAVLPAEVFPTTCHFFIYLYSGLFPFRQSLANSPVAIFCTEHVPEETCLDEDWDVLVVSPNGYSFFIFASIIAFSIFAVWNSFVSLTNAVSYYS